MPTMSARLDPWLKESIEDFWRSHGEGPSTGLRRVAEEWWAMQNLPEITFVDGVAGRRALEYGKIFPQEIHSMIENNRRVERLVDSTR